MTTKSTGLLHGLRRWEMVAWMCSALCIAYTLRVNMSVAVEDMSEELGWSTSQEGLVLSSFYWGYTLGQIPAGRYAHRYGAKRVLAASIFIPASLSLLVPIAAETDFLMVIALRAIIGLFAAGNFPSVYTFFYIWVAPKEKTSMVPCTISGMYMGEIIGFSLSGYLTGIPLRMGDTSMGNWRLLFYVFGLVAIAWVPLWLYFTYERPEDHPLITQEELEFIKAPADHTDDKHAKARKDSDSLSTSLLHGQDSSTNYPSSLENDLKYERIDNDTRNPSIESLPQQVAEPPKRVKRRAPWRAFFTHPASLVLLLGCWQQGWIGFMLLSEMPTYLTDELGLSIEAAGVFCIVPFVMLFIFTIGFGRIFNYCQRERGWTTRQVRQCAQYIAWGGSSVFLLVCGYVDNISVALVALTLAQAFIGASQSGLGCAFLDLSPYYSARYTTVGNAVSAVGGIVSPLAVSALLDAFPGSEGWRIVFILTAAMSVLSIVLWYMFQKSEIIDVLDTPGEIIPE